MKNILALVLWGALSGTAFAQTTTGLAAIHVPYYYKGVHCSIIARQIAWSLDHEPQKWSNDGYQLHRGDAYVWIGNGQDDVQLGRSENGESGWDDDCGKQMVWAAFQRWLVREEGR